MFLNLFLFYQVVWLLGHKSVNRYLYLSSFSALTLLVGSFDP